MKSIPVFKCSAVAVSIILFLSGCNPSGRKYELARKETDSLGAVYVPDQRMGIRDISLEYRNSGTMILKGETTSPELKAAIIKTLSNHINNLNDSIIILPDTVRNKKYMALVTISVINLRKNPAHSAELVSQAILGTPLKIIKDEDSWLLVQTPDSYLGWVEESSVVPLDIAGLNGWRNSRRVISIVSSDRVYSAPDMKETVGDIVAGCIFVNLGELHGFTKVSFPDGRTGYVDSRSVVDFGNWKTTVKCTGESVVKCASAFTGLPYLWGGTSSKAMDCSGLSKTVYFLNGLILLRDASQQAMHGIDVDITSGYSMLRPGDLLFFGSRRNSKLHVTHVAIYEGNKEYINSSGRVKVDSLDPADGNYNSRGKNSLLAARRVIGAENDPGIVRVNSHPWY